MPTPIGKEDALQLKALLERLDREDQNTGYRILPERFNAPLAGTGQECRYVFHERERLAFFSRHVDIAGRRCIDIGCSTGYFLFSLLDAGAGSVVGYEGRKSSGELVRALIATSGEQQRFEFFNEFFQFGIGEERYDVGLLLNVLHHLGGDYGNGALDMAQAKQHFMEQLNRMSTQVGTLVFQLGFNWKGDRRLGLFEHGSKAELIEFVRGGTEGHWDIAAIGIPEKDAAGGISYQPLDECNIARDDSLGEFLNRPLFVLRSRRFAAA